MSPDDEDAPSGGAKSAIGAGSIIGRLRARLAAKARDAEQALGEAELTPVQVAFWAQDKAQGETPALTRTRAWRLRGPLCEDAMLEAMGALIDRQGALRMRVLAHDGAPKPRFDPPGEPARADRIAPLADLSDLDPEEVEHALAATLRAFAFQRFELDDAPLAALRLLRIGPTEHVLVVATHHIVGDDWSFDLMAGELGALYLQALDQGAGPEPLEVDFEQRLRRRRPPPRAGAGEVGQGPKLKWPSAQDAEADADFAARAVSLPLEAAAADAIRAVAAAQSITLFSALAAAFQVLLGRYCDQETVSVGVAYADRARVADEALIGPFIRQGPLAAELRRETSLHALARDAHRSLLRLRDDPGERSAEFDAMLVFYNAPEQGFRILGLSVETVSLADRPTPIDLHLAVRPASDGGLRLELIGRNAVFAEAELRALLAAYRRALRSAAEAPETPIGEIDLIGEEIADAAAAAQAEAPLDEERCVARHFEEAARRWPDEIALRTPEGVWSYRALDALGERVAAWLEAEGVRPGDPVGALAPRGAWLVALHLGALKAGAVVAPLDPDYPDQRLRHMLDAAGAQLVLVPPGQAPTLDLGRRVLSAPDLETPPRARAADGPNVDPRAPAYLFFTSGSTGLPKAVLATHLGVARFMTGLPQPPLGPGDRVLLLTSPSFDPTLIEIWGALFHGAELITPDWTTPSARDLGRSLREAGVTAGCMTAGLFNVLVDEDPEALASLRWLLVGGEAMSARHARAALAAAPGLCLWNVYGPTENAIYTTAYEVGPDVPDRVPIGRPMANNLAFVLGPDMRPAPVGFAGELYLGGPGLALGYKDAPPEKQAAFRSAPPAMLGLEGDEPVRLYRTGDRGRRAANGELEFLGRIDSQFKINGVRVEPGEVERAVAAHPAVSRAVVEPRRGEAGGAIDGLTAYFESADESLTGAALRAHALGRLPRAMVPSRWIRSPAFPLTANGKVDRTALARLGAEASAGPRVAQPPREDAAVDPALAEIWRHHLGAPSAGADDDFFECGGGSLQAIRLIARVERRFGAAIDVTAFLRDPRLRALQEMIARGASNPAAAAGPSIVDAIQKGDASREPAAFAPGVGGAYDWAYNMAAAWDADRPLFGLSLRPLTDDIAAADDLAPLADRLIEEIYARTGGRRLHFVGYSFAGFMAFLMASRALDRGLPVGRVIMFDSATNLERPTPELVEVASRSSGAELTLSERLRLLKMRTPIEPAALRADVFQCKTPPGAIRWASAQDWTALCRDGANILTTPCHHGEITRGDYARQAARRTERLLSETSPERLSPHRAWPAGSDRRSFGARAFAAKRAALAGDQPRAEKEYFALLDDCLRDQRAAPIWLLSGALSDVAPAALRAVSGRLDRADAMNAPALMWLATRLHHCGEREAAGAHAADALALDPSHSVTGAFTTLLLLRGGEKEAANALAADLGREDQNGAEARTARGLCLLADGDHAAARQALQAAMAKAEDVKNTAMTRFVAAQLERLA